MFSRYRIQWPQPTGDLKADLNAVILALENWRSALEEKNGLDIDQAANVRSGGLVTSSSATAGIGYATGAGGTVTQATNKATAVTLNTTCGRITMNNANLAANTTVFFQLNNSNVVAGDIVMVQVYGGIAAFGTYNAWAENPVGGAVQICLRNITAGALAEAVQLRFLILKGVEA